LTNRKHKTKQEVLGSLEKNREQQEAKRPWHYSSIWVSSLIYRSFKFLVNVGPTTHTWIPTISPQVWFSQSLYSIHYT